MSIKQIFRKVKGQQIRVPCLYSLSPSWKARLNPEYDETVEASVDAWRRRWLSDPLCYKRNVAADCGFFTRTMNPDATRFKMQIVGMLGSWVFAWDDVLDFGTLDLGTKKLELFHGETLNVIRKSILEDPTMIPGPKVIAPNFTITRSFYEIGVLIRAGSEHVAIREFVCNTLCDYVTAAVKMEDAFQEDVIQEIDEYLDNRMGSSCVFGMIAISLYARDTDIPAWFLNHPLAKEMMRHVNVMVALDNDIVSAHHELDCKHVDNLVLLLVHHRGMTPQEGVDHCCQLIRESYYTIENLESEILDLAVEHDILEQARVFVSCCKNVRIGLVNWLYTIKRYLDVQPMEGTEVVITLG